MSTSKQTIQDWFKEGVASKATHLIVVCDTFGYEDYPVFVRPEEDVKERFNEYDNKDMQRVMEVYDLSLPMEEQIEEFRAFHLGEPL